MDFERFYDQDVLNIFVDASVKNHKYFNRGPDYDSCSGAIAVKGLDNRIKSIYRVHSQCTNNLGEIRAIKLGVSLAIYYGKQFSTINLFSDSQLSLLGIRDRIFTWRCDDGVIYGYEDTIKSQEEFIEIMNMIVDYGVHINFYHQKGHVNQRHFDSIVNAEKVFRASNNVIEEVPLKFIRDISTWNSRVDDESRTVLLKTDTYKNKLITPIKFKPYNFYEALEKYETIQGGPNNGRFRR